MPVFERRSAMPVPADELYAYHARPGAFQRLAPPWHKLRALEESGGVTGGRLTFQYRVGPHRGRWAAEMGGHEEGRQFVDRQLGGPFAAWEHTHRFVPVDEQTSELHDRVEYSLPAGRLTDTVGRRPAERQLDRVFAFRHERTRADLERHAVWAAEPRFKVAIAGASGLIGGGLSSYLTTAGHEVVRLVRRPAAGPDEVSWSPAAGRLDPAGLAGVDAVVNVAGVSLAGLWTKGRRGAIRASRVDSARTLAAAMAKMDPPPRVFVSASAVGAYGSRGGEEVTEEVGLGSGFLADVCREWEAAASAAAESGVRVVTPRFGIMMSGAGGVLGPVLPLFRAGLGGQLGDGRQWWSWVDLDDGLAALEWMLHDEELAGPVNLAAPDAVTNHEFTKALAHVLRRPSVFRAPRGALERALGGMAEEMLLASQRAVPAKLTARGFRFARPALDDSLRFQLGRR